MPKVKTLDVPCVPTVKWFCRSGQRHVQVPFMPNSIPAWLEERHAEMHDALMNGETARVCLGIEFQVACVREGEGRGQS